MTDYNRWQKRAYAKHMAQPLLVRLRELSVCEPGCEGRCMECPQDLVNRAIARIEELERKEVENATAITGRPAQ